MTGAFLYLKEFKTLIDVISPEYQDSILLVGRIAVQTTSRSGKRLPYLLDSYRVLSVRGHSLVVVPTASSRKRDSIPYKTVAMACDTEQELASILSVVNHGTLTTEHKFRQLLRLAGFPVDAEDEIKERRTRKLRRPST